MDKILELCPICNRPLGTANVQSHHLIPKCFKGKELVDIHKVCHRKIHATFTERELLKTYHTVEKLVEHEEIQKFVKWIANKEPEFYDTSKETKVRKAKRG